MKKIISIILVIIFSTTFCSCGQKETNKTEYGTTKELYVPSDDENKNSYSENRYVGNYEEDPIYRKIDEIEKCTDPDTLASILEKLYNNKISYIKMEYIKSDHNSGYAPPYEKFLCAYFALYNTKRGKGLIDTDTYLFFEPYNETPLFVMDKDGAYLVKKYEIKNLENGECHYIDSCLAVDLYMCLHGYIDADQEEKDFWKESVGYMKYYIDFEKRISNSLK